MPPYIWCMSKGYKMLKENFIDIFSHYSYLSDETIVSNLLEKVDKKELNNIKSIADLKRFLFQLNKKVDTPDILSRLFILDANINIIDGYLEAKEEEGQDLRELNAQNKRILREVLLMLESKV